MLSKLLRRSPAVSVLQVAREDDAEEDEEPMTAKIRIPRTAPPRFFLRANCPGFSHCEKERVCSGACNCRCLSISPFH